MPERQDVWPVFEVRVRRALMMPALVPPAAWTLFDATLPPEFQT
jgi:hypothetical protein